MGCSASRVRASKVSPIIDAAVSFRGKIDATLSAHVSIEKEGQDVRGCEVHSPRIGRCSERMDPQHTMIIFDWDDTLCPTTWAQRLVGRYQSGQMRQADAQYQEVADALAHLVAEILTLAQSLGKVAIVTNASRGWVGQTCAAVMAPAQAALNQIPVVYAQDLMSNAEKRRMSWPELQTEAKVRAMRNLIRGLHPDQTCKNVLSIGDASFERVAVRKVVEAQPRAQEHKACRRKSIKMVEKPTLELVSLQLEAVSAWLTKVVQVDRDLDIDFGE